MDFHCTPCNKTFARDPNPHETPFEVPGYEGIFLSGFVGRVVGGRMVIEAAACPQCSATAPRSCTTRPRVGDHLADACPDCGHATVLHIGVDRCPVCEMADLNKQLAAIVEGGSDEALQRAMLRRGMRNPQAYASYTR